MSMRISARKLYEIMDVIALLCCVLEILSILLIAAILLISASGWGCLTFSTLIPVLFAIILILILDLIALQKRKFITWTCFSFALKFFIFMTSFLNMLFNFNNLYLVVLAFIAIAIVPSLWNIARIIDVLYSENPLIRAKKI